MSNYLIDKVEDIGARLKEIEAEKDVARTGTSAAVTGQEPKTEDIQTIAQSWHGWTYSQQPDSVEGCI
jgi:hypothetical protein